MLVSVLCVQIFFQNRTLEIDSVSNVLTWTFIHFYQSLIASVTLPLPDNSAVSVNAQARRPPYDIWSIVHRSTYACTTKSKMSKRSLKVFLRAACKHL